MKLDPQALIRLTNQVNAAFVATVQGFANTCQEHITDERWDWPRETVRSDGSIVGSPRDAVDTGRLRDSQTQPFYQSTSAGLKATITWAPVGEDGKEYALAVHNGEVDGGVVKPGRPWTETALEAVDVGKTFTQECQRFLG